MNTYCYGQWVRYCAERPWLDGFDRAVLLAYVHHHGAHDQVSRPSADTLAAFTGFNRKTVMVHVRRLAADGHLDLTTPAATGGHPAARRAAEYALPWLHNPVSVVQKRTTGAAADRPGPRSKLGPRNGPRNGPPPIGTDVPINTGVASFEADDAGGDENDAPRINVAAAIDRWRRERNTGT